MPKRARQETHCNGSACKGTPKPLINPWFFLILSFFPWKRLIRSRVFPVLVERSWVFCIFPWLSARFLWHFKAPGSVTMYPFLKSFSRCKLSSISVFFSLSCNFWKVFSGLNRIIPYFVVGLLSSLLPQCFDPFLFFPQQHHLIFLAISLDFHRRLKWTFLFWNESRCKDVLWLVMSSQCNVPIFRKFEIISWFSIERSRIHHVLWIKLASYKNSDLRDFLLF